MSESKKIKSALVSVYHKDGLDEIIKLLDKNKISIYSTGGTKEFIEGLGVNVISVEEITSYPSILGGRVKTLHPKIFGGILGRRNHETDTIQLEQYEIPEIDLVLVDLYPFKETVAAGGSDDEIIEKIDIGGISLIRAAAKNFKDVLIIPSKDQYGFLKNILIEKGETNIKQRKEMAKAAFAVSSTYDTAIHNYFSGEKTEDEKILRYGENPHQQGIFKGHLDEIFDQLHGKELSYNNLLDVDAAVNLISEFEESAEATLAILKHNNACGIASDNQLSGAYKKALSADPLSAFGGVIISNKKIDRETASAMNDLFFEILIAPDFEKDALDILQQKKNRILLKQKKFSLPKKQIRSVLNGILEQEKDMKQVDKSELRVVTKLSPDEAQLEDLIFANKIVKHTKSNAIVLVKNKQMLGSGAGQTSRIDALNHAIAKAKHFGFGLNGAAMASDAFFPFPDCVEIAAGANIKAIIQPGGSIKDKDSIDAADKWGIAMVFSGIRHFRH
ncbi:MAG: bifunctional phosphoribosylaminoimidazolecarboxamide formyltransferase/IMP cyclohydrolase [Nitrosopumilus sp.]|nr:bifunctional phosphoribosylaminoimidazolecarboxamide formyltransferase/IMP cyclohydrolase [Nitrosopumilus sp.]